MCQVIYFLSKQNKENKKIITIFDNELKNKELYSELNLLDIINIFFYYMHFDKESVNLKIISIIFYNLTQKQEKIEKIDDYSKIGYIIDKILPYQNLEFEIEKEKFCKNFLLELINRKEDFIFSNKISLISICQILAGYFRIKKTYPKLLSHDLKKKIFGLISSRLLLEKNNLKEINIYLSLIHFFSQERIIISDKIWDFFEKELNNLENNFSIENLGFFCISLRNINNFNNNFWEKIEQLIIKFLKKFNINNEIPFKNILFFLESSNKISNIDLWKNIESILKDNCLLFKAKIFSSCVIYVSKFFILYESEFFDW